MRTGSGWVGMAHILLTAIRIVTATAVMDQISREGSARVVVLRQGREGRGWSRGEAAEGQPEKGIKAGEVGGGGSRMVGTRLLSRQGMYFSRGKAAASGVRSSGGSSGAATSSDERHKRPSATLGVATALSFPL